MDGFKKEKMYKGADAADVLLDELTKETREIFDKYIKKPKKMIWNDVAKAKYEAASHCHICKDEFKDPIPCTSQCETKSCHMQRELQ